LLVEAGVDHGGGGVSCEGCVDGEVLERAQHDAVVELHEVGMDV
jgi:hypothetical protein